MILLQFLKFLLLKTRQSIILLAFLLLSLLKTTRTNDIPGYFRIPAAQKGPEAQYYQHFC